ncbi:MAG: competence/damage-inducible protein A [Deltaproteobacteria bacterium]|nr:competence/damage-inducible protein A [Deltaproteobacteria bacterium]
MVERDVVILPVGREMLTGRVLDTNSQWLAARLFEAGVRVTRVSAVDDELRAIAREVRRAAADRAAVLITTGGLGPTPDDMTLRGVAMGLRRPWLPDPAALDHVRERYAALHAAGRIADPSLTPDRAKMASLPRGSRVVPNPVGTAPGIDLAAGRMRVFCLPGVPAEMRAMASASVLPAVRALATTAMVRHTIEAGSRDESTLAAAIRATQPAFPDVHFKPDPKGFGGERRMFVHLETAAPDADAALARLHDAACALLAALAPS